MRINIISFNYLIQYFYESNNNPTVVQNKLEMIKKLKVLQNVLIYSKIISKWEESSIVPILIF